MVSMAAGVLLVRGVRLGVLLSRGIQALQVVRLYTGWFALGFVIGPSVTAVWINGTPDLVIGANAAADVYWNTSQLDKRGIAINLFAILMLIWLLKRWRQPTPAPSPSAGSAIDLSPGPDILREP